MQPIPFNPESDLAPIPFDRETCKRGAALKQAGLPWHPHVGCFVWDPGRCIKSASPFPHDIYFILSLPRFIDIFGSRDAIQEKLIWLPTWHQTWLLCQRYGIDPALPSAASPTEALNTLYRQLYSVLSA
jgi:hypothetical protein